MFEEVLLKSLIYDGEIFNKCFNILNSGYFKHLGNAEVFNLLKKYYTEYHERPTETSLIVMVKDVANAEIRNEIIDSLKKITKTELSTNQKFICDETIKFVKDAICYKALEMGSEGLTNKNDELIKKSQQLMEEMSKVQIDSNLGLSFDDIESQLEYYAKRNYGIKTTHPSINKRLGDGFLPGTLNILLSPAGVGKTMIKCDFISGMLQNGKNILMVSLEMSEHEIMKRIHANVLNIPINTFTDLSRTPGEIENKINDEVSNGGMFRNPTTKDEILNQFNLVKNSGTCGKFFVKEYPAGSFSALMLQDLVDNYKNEKGITFDAVFIDYLGIMKSDLVSPRSGLYSYIKSIGEEVRAFAVKNSIAVISSSQLNRGAVNKTEGVDNSMISDSLGTAMTADLMIFIIQNEEMKQKSEVLLKFTKNRYTGITDSFVMNVDYKKMRLNEMKFNIGKGTEEVISYQNTEDKTKYEKIAKDTINQNIINDAKALKSNKVTNEDLESMLGELL